MLQIRPVSDLRNKFPEIEKIVNEGQPVYLTKNGYGAMVVLSIEKYSAMITDIESKLDEADRVAEYSHFRLEHQDVFDKARSIANDKKSL